MFISFCTLNKFLGQFAPYTYYLLQLNQLGYSGQLLNEQPTQSREQTEKNKTNDKWLIIHITPMAFLICS